MSDSEEEKEKIIITSELFTQYSRKELESVLKRALKKTLIRVFVTPIPHIKMTREYFPDCVDDEDAVPRRHKFWESDCVVSLYNVKTNTLFQIFPTRRYVPMDYFSLTSKDKVFLIPDEQRTQSKGHETFAKHIIQYYVCEEQNALVKYKITTSQKYVNIADMLLVRYSKWKNAGDLETPTSVHCAYNVSIDPETSEFGLKIVEEPY